MCIFFSATSGTLVYQPEVDFSYHYGAEIPSIQVIPCCVSCQKWFVFATIADIAKAFDMKILVDEMHEYGSEMLKSQGFEAYSARELRETHNISSDYSILKYAQENKMFFITSDKESGAGCTEQGIPHLFLDDEMIFDLVLSKLRESA